MEALNTLVKQFQDGAILTNEELNQIVSYINQIVEYINNNIKPAIENGIQGKMVEMELMEEMEEMVQKEFLL